MNYNELKNLLVSVSNNVENLNDRVSDLKSEASNVWAIDPKGCGIRDSLKGMSPEIEKCRNKTELVTKRIENMIANKNRITPEQATELESEQYSINKEFNILTNQYGEAYSILVNINIWASLQDIWESFIYTVTQAAGIAANWTFRNLVIPVIPGGSEPKLLEGVSSWWQGIFGQ